jgi:hypothetical protein
MKTYRRGLSLRLPLAERSLHGLTAALAIAASFAVVGCSNSPQGEPPSALGQNANAVRTGSASATTTDGGPDATTGIAGVLTACSWPASLDGGTDWSVGRTLLTCQFPTYSEGCLSDGLSGCPHSGSAVSAAPIASDAGEGSCVDECATDEYAVRVGGPPKRTDDGGSTDSPTPPLPSTCRFQAANPGGQSFYCCPCD